MRDCIEKWCEPSDINAEYLESAAMDLVDAGHTVDSAYVSGDLYFSLLKQFNDLRCSHNATVTQTTEHKDLCFYSYVGAIKINLVSGFNNYIHIGTESTFKNSWRMTVDKEFEEVFLNG